MIHDDRHHQRKAAKTKGNELKLVLNFDKDGKKEEKMVKEILKEGSEVQDVTVSSVPLTAVGSASSATEGNDDIAAVGSDAHHQLASQKLQSPFRFNRAEGEGRTEGAFRNHLQQEAAVSVQKDEQSKVNHRFMISSFIYKVT
jgi:hypothetical protein